MKQVRGILLFFVVFVIVSCSNAVSFNTPTHQKDCVKNIPFDIDPNKMYRNFFDKNHQQYAWKPPVVLFFGGYEFGPYSLRMSPQSEKYWNEYGIYIVNVNPHSSVVCTNVGEKKKYTALGQEYDALALLEGLLLCHEKGLEKVYVLGECRGAAAVITALTMLSEPYAYASWWKDLCVVENGALDLNKINAMKKMVQKGIVYLGYPLLDLNYFLAEWYDKYSKGGIKDLLQTSIKLDLTKPSAGALLKKLVERNEFDIVIDFVKDDVVVGNKYDVFFYEVMKRKSDRLKVMYTSTRHGDRDTMLSEALKVYLQDIEHDRQKSQKIIKSKL